MSHGKDVVSLVGIREYFDVVGSLGEVHSAFMVLSEFGSHSIVVPAVFFVEDFPFVVFAVEGFKDLFIAV